MTLNILPYIFSLQLTIQGCGGIIKYTYPHGNGHLWWNNVTQYSSYGETTLNKIEGGVGVMETQFVFKWGQIYLINDFNLTNIFIIYRILTTVYTKVTEKFWTMEEVGHCRVLLPPHKFRKYTKWDLYITQLSSFTTLLFYSNINNSKNY